ncbi:nitroreductase family protein [bacterium]|nr:nitroreductase family protein [candidate division CSSED10-310 bacterium]
MESILNLMKCRRGVRQFADRAVPEKVLSKILEAAIYAPSGVGGAHILVVDDQELRKKIRSICEIGERQWVDSQPLSVRERIVAQPNFSYSLEFLETAPALLIVSTRPRDPERPYAVECAFLAVGYMLVMIEGLGLGTITYTPSVTDEKQSKILEELLGLPEGEKIQVILPVGYPESKPKHDTGKAQYSVFHNRFGEPFTLAT